LERFSEDDEKVRKLLDRKGKVRDLRLKSDSQVKQSLNTIANSPSRQFKSSYRKSPQKQYPWYKPIDGTFSNISKMISYIWNFDII